MEFNVGEIKEQTKVVTSIDFKTKKKVLKYYILVVAVWMLDMIK